jgi:hypothetical protein
MDQNREHLLREYAAGRTSWSILQQQGFGDYVTVLSGLGELGLRPPMAPLEGPSKKARERGIAQLRNLIARQTPP